MLRKFKFSLLAALLLSLFIASCSDNNTTDSNNDNLDPNGEEAKLVDFKNSEGAGIVKVMTRNIYIGTDVSIVLDAKTPEEIPVKVAQAYNMLLATDYATRADALAEEIGKTLPHLVGLQEVSTFYKQSPGDMAIGGTVPATDVDIDLEQGLLDALTARGLNYTVVARDTNSDIELPMLKGVDGNGNPLLDDIRIVDHDVVLARNDVICNNTVTGRFQAALVDPSTGIVTPRGYVITTAQSGGAQYVFANTHLEAFGPEDNPELIRGPQAQEYLAVINTYNTSNLPVIMLGDFNAPAPTNDTYTYVINQGYTDSWLNNTLTYNTNGYTYGHQADLKNTEPNFYERIDFIFVKANSATVTYGEGFVLGDEKRDIRGGLWPSDHGGVVFKITISN
jgi:hypothetical protein